MIAVRARRRMASGWRLVAVVACGRRRLRVARVLDVALDDPSFSLSWIHVQPVRVFALSRAS